MTTNMGASNQHVQVVVNGQPDVTYAEDDEGDGSNYSNQASSGPYKNNSN